MKKIKRTLCGFLAVLVAFSVIAASSASAIILAAGGFKYNRLTDGAEIIGYDDDSPLIGTGTLNIPVNLDGRQVIGIYKSAFMNDTTIKNLSLPYTVKTIGDFAFANDTGITSITIPRDTTTVGISAFSGCTSATSITFAGSNVTKLDRFAFAGCAGVTDVTLPRSITRLEDYLFTNCTSLKAVYVPSSVTTFGTTPFAGCTNLTIFGEKGSAIEAYAKAFKIPFIDKASINKDNLYIAIINANYKLSQDMSVYTNASVAALKEATQKGEEVNNYSFSIQSDIDKAAQNISNAVNALAPYTAKEDLNNIISTIHNIVLGDTSVYTEDTLKTLENAYNNGRVINDSAYATQEMVTEAYVNCKTALDNLKIQETYNNPQAVLAEAKDILTNRRSDYTAQSISTLEISYNYAEPVINNPNATAGAKAIAGKNLQNELNAMVILVDTEKLRTELAQAADILTNKAEDYTEETIKVLQTKYDAAKIIMDDEAHLQADVDLAAKELQTAIDNLVENPKFIIPGDANNDGKITVTDAIMVKKHIAKITLLTGDQFIGGDYNRDGKINVADCVSIQKTIAKILPVITG